MKTFTPDIKNFFLLLKKTTITIVGAVALLFYSCVTTAQIVFPAAGPKTYIVISNGTNANGGAYLVVGNPAANAIRNGGTTGGWIISEGQYNYVDWKNPSASTNYVFPFGYSTTDYLPFTFNTTTGGAAELKVSTWGTGSDNTPWAGATDVAAVANMHDLNGQTDGSICCVIDRWWTIYTTGANASLTFTYRGAENTMSSGTGATIGIQHWNGTCWNDGKGGGSGTVTTTGTLGSTSGDITLPAISGFTEFSPYVLVSLPNPLPIELLDFTAECVTYSNNQSSGEGRAILNWSTASEQNADYFTIERSSDGINYSTVGTMPASGNSNTVKKYSYIDDGLAFVGVLYYRLSQTDYDGHSQSFAPVSATCFENIGFSVKIYPNPVSNGNIYVAINGAANENVLLELTDILGRKIYSKTLSEPTNDYLFNIKLDDNIVEGVYFINASIGDKYFNKKIIIIR